MRYVLFSLLLLSACAEEVVEPGVPVIVLEAPENCTNEWAYARTEAYYTEREFWPAIAEPATVLGLNFCPSAPGSILFMDVEFTGEPHTHRFTIAVEASTMVWEGDTVRYQCTVLDLPVGEADTSATVRTRYGTQHDVSGINMPGAEVVVLDFGEFEVAY